MEISLNIILDQLAPFSPRVVKKSEGPQAYGSWRFYTDQAGTKPEKTGTLYLMQSGEPAACAGTLGARDAILCSRPADAQACGALACTVVCVDAGADLAELCNALSALFLRLFRWEADIDRVIDKNLGLQAFLDVSEDLFTNPVCFITNSLQMPACTKHIKIPHPSIRYAKNHRILPPEMIKAVVERGYLSESEGHEKLEYSYDKNYVGCPILLMAFPENKMHVKTIGLYNMNTPPCEAEYDRMQLLCEKAYRYLIEELGSNKDERDQDREALMLTAMLEGKAEESELATYESLLKISVASDFDLYVICFNKFNRSHMNFMLHTLPGALHNVHTFPYREQIILLADTAGKTESERLRLHDFLKNLMLDNDTYCGIGSFTGLMELRCGYQMATSAAVLGSRLDPEKLLYPFEDYFFDYMVQCASRDLPLNMLYMREIDRLAEYDKSHDTAYVQLLWLCFEKSRIQVNEVADAANLHRNSVRYRLAKIQEIMQADFEDSDTRFKLYASLKIYESAQREKSRRT